MTRYIHQLPDWPDFRWIQEVLVAPLADISHRQGRLLGRMEGLGFSLQKEAELATLTLDVLKSSEIEGEKLNADQVRSSIARRLGMDIAGAIPADRDVEGVVEMMLDATQNIAKPHDTALREFFGRLVMCIGNQNRERGLFQISTASCLNILDGCALSGLHSQPLMIPTAEKRTSRR